MQHTLPLIFSVEPRPPLPMKGKAESLPVFVLTGRRQPRTIRLQEPAYALPMIGRQRELATISTFMERAVHGQGQVVGIVADAGLGKSRLLAEVIRLANKLGFIGYGGACQSDGINTAYLVWQPIWRAFFDVDPAMPPRRLLGAVLDIALPDNDFTHSLESQYRKSALEALLLDCLVAAAREAPLLLEDAHWLDALSHNLLDWLAGGLADLPVVIVLAYRPPELQRLQAPRVEALPHFTRLSLGR